MFHSIEKIIKKENRKNIIPTMVTTVTTMMTATIRKKRNSCNRKKGKGKGIEKLSTKKYLN